MSIELLAEAQEAAFKALADICINPEAYDVETQKLRADVAFSVVNMLPAGALDFPEHPQPQLEEAPEDVGYGEVVDFPEQPAISAEERAAIEQVTVNHQPSPLNPHSAPPLGGAG